MQCILYRELLSHNGIDTQNIKIVSASKKAGVQDFDLMDSKITRDSSKLIKVFSDARDEAFGKLKVFQESKKSLVGAA
jgi:ACT domain-containing protein